MSARAWSAALDLQLDLVRWWDTDEAKNAAHAAVDFMVDEAYSASSEKFDRWHGRAGQHAGIMIHSLGRAATYWVSAEMGRFLSYAQQDFPPHALTNEDPPYLDGFIYFEQPMVFEVAGLPGHGQRELQTQALHWCSFAYGEDPEADNPAVLWLELYCPGSRRPQAYGMLPYGETAADTIQRTVQAFWALSQQRVTNVAQHPYERHARKRAERAGLKVPEDGVRVVTLRRHEERPTRGETTVEWSHRWIVSGHWRNQWYPGADEHRPKWIDAYPKGPEDKPLVVKDRVYRWVR